MSDHGLSTSPEATWFGIKAAYAVAGFWGGVISLSFIRNLTIWQGAMAVITGVVSSSYLTPIAVHYLLSPTAEIYEAKAYALAFVIGLTAMNIIPGILKLSDFWKRNPWLFIKGAQDGNRSGE